MQYTVFADICESRRLLGEVCCITNYFSDCEPKTWVVIDISVSICPLKFGKTISNYTDITPHRQWKKHMFFIKYWKYKMYGYHEFHNCPPSYDFNTWTQPFVLCHSNNCKLDITADLHWSTISKDIQKCPRVCACVQFSYAMLYRNVYFCNLFIRAWFTLCEMWRECLLPLLCSSYKNKSWNVFLSLRGKSVRNAEKSAIFLTF